MDSVSERKLRAECDSPDRPVYAIQNLSNNASSPSIDTGKIVMCKISFPDAVGKVGAFTQQIPSHSLTTIVLFCFSQSQRTLVC